MKLEFRMDGKVVSIEAEGLVSVHICGEEAAAAPARLADTAARLQKMAVVPASKPEPPPATPDLYQKLVDLRRELAAEQSVPPYVVFKDQTLRDMADKRPANREEFGNLDGVGRAKLDKYGDLFLEVIRSAA